MGWRAGGSGGLLSHSFYNFTAQVDFALRNYFDSQQVNLAGDKKHGQVLMEKKTVKKLIQVHESAEEELN